MRQGAIVVDEIDDLTVADGQALVRTVACGICGSDLHALVHGAHMVEMQRKAGGPIQMDLSRDVVMGHEFCAEVLELGPGAPSQVSEGDLVCSVPVVVSGGRVHAVGYSNDVPGGYAENMLLTSAMMLPVPNGLSPDLAALTEPMAVGRHAVEKARATAEDVCLVIGCGPVGLAVIAALKQKGLGPVIAADFSPRRRALAEQLGADEVLDPGDSSPYDRWQDVAWPEGVDRNDPMIRFSGVTPRPGLIFECVGVPGVISQVFDGSMRDTRIVVVGVCMEEDTVFPLMGISKELNVQFVLGYTPDEFADSLRGIAEGELPAEPLITGRVGIDGVAQAFTDLADPESHAKIIVDPSLSPRS